VTELPPAIEIDGLTKVYPGGVRAVDRVSLAVPSGQVLGFLGPNGAGKTTTIKILAGLLSATEGRVRLNGFDVARNRSAATEQFGAVLEGSRNVYWTLSAWQNLMYFGRLKGMRAREVRARAGELLADLGLWDRRNEKVGGYSRGMQQKLAVAAALIADPRVVLLDEPTVGLDVEATRTVKDCFSTVSPSAASGRTAPPALMNVVLHGMEEAAGVRHITTGSNAGTARPGSPVLIRYADDALALCHPREQAQQVQARLAAWLEPRGLAFAGGDPDRGPLWAERTTESIATADALAPQRTVIHNIKPGRGEHRKRTY
jgi:ABC-type Na+ transport system ATPase subunit NatA